MKLNLRHASTAAALLICAACALLLTASPRSAERTYVGQETCMSAGCHENAYHDSSDYKGADAFRATLHQKTHLRPTPETMLMERYFAGDSVLRMVLPQVPIPGQDTLLVELGKSNDGAEYHVQMRISNGGDATPIMKIEYTHGGYGWSQRYLVRIGDNLHVLPFQYALPAYREHSDTSRAYSFVDVGRWLRIEAGVASFIPQSSSSFRAFSWDRDCAACHVSGLDVDVTVVGTETMYTALWTGRRQNDSALTDQNSKVGCESCHGPGSEHAAAPTSENIISPGRWGATAQATDLKLDLCNACHTRVHSTGGVLHYPFDETSQREYVPGQPLTPYYRLQYGDMITWADRTTSLAHHQTGQGYSRSKHYESHVFENGCWDCHTVHNAGNVALPYQLKEDHYSVVDGDACLTCHGSAGPLRTPPLEDMSATELRDGLTINRHTQHSLAASACVNCHLTKAATVSFTDLPRKPMLELSQHDFRVRRPSLTLEFRTDFVGMLNTCAAACHRNGRGSRNFSDSMPVAPSFGIVDRNLGAWKESSDLALADSLWRRYQVMYEKYIRASVESSTPSPASAITGVAPNPIASSSRISFTVARSGVVSLEVFDLEGRFRRALAGGRHSSGSYVVEWDGTGESGERLPAGTYVMRLKVGETTSAWKVALTNWF